MQSIEQIGDDYGGTIALAGLLVALMALGVGIMALRDRRSWHAQLRDRSAWPTLLTDLNMLGPKPRYLAGTARFNTLADLWFGERLLSWRVLDQCLRIELLLPVLCALAGWVLFNISAVGGVNIAAPDLNEWRRHVDGIVIVICIVVTLWIAANESKFVGVPNRALRSVISVFPTQIRTKLITRSEIAVSTVVRSFGLTAGLLYLSLMTYVADSFTLISVIAVFTTATWGGITITAVFTGALLLYVIVTAVVVYITELSSIAQLGPLESYLSSDASQAQVYDTILLFCFLPVVNALADVVSVTATRVFMRRIARGGQTVLTIAVELVFDLILAIITLFALIFAICAGLDLWADLAPGRLAFDWRAYRQQVLDAPTAGIMLYGMAVTTLIPTLMHVAAGTAALFGTRGHLVALARDHLSELNANLPAGTQIPPETAQGPLRAIDKMLRRSHRSGWIAGFLCAVLVAAIAAALVGWVLTWWPTLQAFPYA